MGQSRSIEVALMIDENLGLVNKAAERRAMNNSVAVSLKLTAVRGFLFLELPSEAMILVCSVGLKCVHRPVGAPRSGGLRRIP